ncbi:hypothetical protein AALP_AA3G029500 [Arabis alpina]|uniref:Uncharacterized protein n=1 Tax=Arabis alpina TaxID=50452 RepID=A0A087H6N9_ARAAL|nr:hypothetical protein AALP_AA3G029500 [Arabis alpina]
MIVGDKCSGGSSWSRDDDISFERALTIFADDQTDEIHWEDIAAFVPGKTSEQIEEIYNILVHDVMMIESGCVPLPDYDFSKTDLNSNDKECDNGSVREYKQKGEPKAKQNPRRGVPWTLEEHIRFLDGLEKYGKGDWRSISRKFVVTRTPIQVASHAQKYFARLNSKNKTKKRTSIHDITVAENTSVSPQRRPITWQNNNINVASVYGTPNTWNTHQAISQPSLDHLPMYGAPTMWYTQAASQPSVNVLMHGQAMVGQMLLPYEYDMNCLAPPPPLAYGVQHQSVPYYSVPSAQINMAGSIPYNMTYLPAQSRI